GVATMTRRFTAEAGALLGPQHHCPPSHVWIKTEVRIGAGQASRASSHNDAALTTASSVGSAFATASSGSMRDENVRPVRSASTPTARNIQAPSLSSNMWLQVVSPNVGAPKLRERGRPRNASVTASAALAVSPSIKTATGG